ncbi:hypothetical protein KSP40_PGU021244 [Platanthera guangdongensis]|uniref:Uncharacterized protein n=1 Tax=Platanthera guangdongensis TaxID=2320717 RepID=A0ABR2MSD3_9ASPA
MEIAREYDELGGEIVLEKIDSAYQESGSDAYKAADILGAELVDPEESPNSYGKKRSAHKKKKWVATSTDMVSGVIGKDHWKSASSCSDRRRGWCDPMKAKEQRAVWAYSCEGAVEFYVFNAF